MTDKANLTHARKSIVEAVMTKVGGDLFRHAVAIAHTRTVQETAPEQVLDSMIGSGTLVQVDSADGHARYGILTCGHAAAALGRARNEKGRRSFTLFLPSNRARGEDQAWTVQIPYDMDMTAIEGADYEDGEGPDLAWMPLNPAHAHSIQDNARSAAVFFNLSTGLKTHALYKERERTQGVKNPEAFLNQQVHLAVGWNMEIHTRSRGRRAGIRMNEVLLERLLPKDGWLYADYRINDDEWTDQEYGDGTRLPSSWQGLSGGAIWQVWRPDPNAECLKKMLVGVPFYQTALSTDRSMSIRTHHDLSLLRLLHRARVAPRDTMTENEIVDEVNKGPQARILGWTS